MRDDVEETRHNGPREHVGIMLFTRARDMVCSMGESVEARGVDEKS